MHSGRCTGRYVQYLQRTVKRNHRQECTEVLHYQLCCAVTTTADAHKAALHPAVLAYGNISHIHQPFLGLQALRNCAHVKSNSWQTLIDMT